MKSLILAVSLVLVGTLASAASVDCSVSDLTATQTQYLAAFLADINEARVEAGQGPYADFPAYCSATMVSAVTSYIESAKQGAAERVGEAAKVNGNDVAPNGQCSAASLPNGCKKGEVACFVLTGNTTCD